MPILNYTTKIAPTKTIAEIQTILGVKGASRVSVDYEGGQPVAIHFELPFQGKQLPFRLPCNVTGVLNVLKKQKVSSSFRNPDQAGRVAWRITKDWIEAQFALVEAGQAEMVEVFLPYAFDPATNRTAYQCFVEGKSALQLTAGK